MRQNSGLLHFLNKYTNYWVHSVALENKFLVTYFVVYCVTQSWDYWIFNIGQGWQGFRIDLEVRLYPKSES